MKYEGLTEEELMKLYQSGDVDALGQMAILLLPKLAAIARSRFSDRNLAEEALQEFWVKKMTQWLQLLRSIFKII